MMSNRSIFLLFYSKVGCYSAHRLQTDLSDFSQISGKTDLPLLPCPSLLQAMIPVSHGVCFSRVRVARAFPGILTFSLSQPSQKSTTTYLVPLPQVTHTGCDWRKAKTAFFDTKLTTLLKIVRKIRVILCNTTHYREIGEGCESKNINFAVRTRARRSQIRGD